MKNNLKRLQQIVKYILIILPLFKAILDMFR